MGIGESLHTMDDAKPKKLERLPTRPTVLLIGIPGPGLIGVLSLSYLIHYFKMNIVGEIEHPDLYSIVFVDDGEILGPVRIYKKGSIFAILSDIPIDYDLAQGFAESVIGFCKKNKIDMVIVLSGIHSQERNLANLKTYGLVTDQSLEKVLYENEIPKFLSGMITGPDATILTFFKNSHIPTMALHTECNFFFPDPEAAIHTIQTLSRILKTEIDIAEFKKQINFLRLQNRQLMQETLNILQQEKVEPTIPPQIYK